MRDERPAQEPERGADPPTSDNTIPGALGGPLYWLTFTFAILACLVASQTVITAVFSLVQQLISFNSCPHLRHRMTSASNQGQVYFASVNYLLCIAVVAVIGGFGTSSALTNA